MSSTKYEGLSYPTHFLKSRLSTIMNNFLKGRAKKAVQILRDEMIIMHCLLENKAKHILKGHFLSFCSDTIYSKSRGDRGKMIHFFEIFFSCFYDLIYLIAFKCITHCQVLATT